MAAQALDAAKARAFAARTLGIMNDAMLALLISVGHQTGLLDTLAALPPGTSDDIAAAAGLHERHVREWLAGLVAGRIVEYDPATRTYTLPPEHAAALTRAAGGNNLAVLAPFVAQFGGIEEAIVAAFREGGGVPYSATPRLQHFQAELGSPTYEATLTTVALPLIPGLVERLRRGVAVLDVGCGAGHALNLMARAFPQSRFTGYDVQEGGLAAARAEADAWRLTNVQFLARDATTLDEPGRYDLITAFDVIHDLARPLETARAIRAALKPDGLFLMLEFAASSNLEDNLDHPLAPGLYTVSLFHCMSVSLAQGGPGLGCMWGEQAARQLLAEAGFDHVEVRQVPGDFFNNYYIARR